MAGLVAHTYSGELCAAAFFAKAFVPPFHFLFSTAREKAGPRSRGAPSYKCWGSRLWLVMVLASWPPFHFNFFV
jgi:hypothetical protein